MTLKELFNQSLFVLNNWMCILYFIQNIVHPVSRQQGLNVAPYADIPLSGNTISKPVIPCSQSAPCTPQKSALKQNLRGISGDTASEFGSPSETDSPGRSSNGGGSTTKNKVLPKEVR